MKVQVQPTLIIGLGGTGTMAASTIKEVANQLFIDPRYEFPLLRFLAIDTEFMTSPHAATIQSRFIDKQRSDQWDQQITNSFQVQLEQSEKIAIEVDKSSMQQWLQNPDQLGAADFIDPKYMERVIKGVAGDGAGGFGIVGKAAFWQHLNIIKNAIEEQLNILNNLTYIERKMAYYKDAYELSSQHQLNIFIICSTGGGTGKGTFLSTAVLVRELLLKMGLSTSDGAEIILVNYTPSCFGVAGRNVGTGYMKSIQSNQYASMKEVDYALRYGYPLEERMKQLLSINDREHSPQIFTNVLQVSAQLENTGAFIGDYATINRSVAETINGFVFGNIIGDFRAYFRSNKGKFISDNSLREHHGLEIDRLRDYGRIGRYRLTFPVDQLFRYAQQYYAVQMVKDFCEGTLCTTPEVERIAPEQIAEEWAATFLKGSQQLLRPQPFINYQQIRQTCSTFDHPWLANIQDSTQGCFNNLAMQFVPSGGKLPPIENRLEAFLKQVMEGTDTQTKCLTTTLQQYCFEYGMVPCIEIIDHLLDYYETHLTQVFKGLLPATSPNPYYQQHFAFGQNGSTLLQLLEEQRQVVEQELVTYTNGAAALYSAADQALRTDKTAWEKKNNRLWKRIIGQDERSLETAEPALKRLIHTAAQLYDKYTSYCKQHILLSAVIRHRELLHDMKQHLLHNFALMQQKDSTNAYLVKGLLKHYQEQLLQILNEPKDSLELRVVGDQEAEFRAFAESLSVKGDRPLVDKIHSTLLPISNDLVTTSLSADTLAAAIEAATATVHPLKEGKSIVNYLRQKVEQGEKAVVKDLLLQLLNNANYLGKLDTSTVSGGNAQVGASSTLIQIQDKDFITREFADILGNAKVVQTDHSEEIIVTKMETALPLFVFKEFVEAGQLYQQQIANNPMAAHEKHSHQRFVTIPEPFGVPTELPEMELQLFIILLLHLGLIRLVNDEVQFKSDVRSDKPQYQYFYDNSKSPRTFHETERRITLKTLLTQFNQRSNWFDFFTGLVCKKVTHLFSIEQPTTRQQAMQYLKRYVNFDPQQSKHFPCFPPIVLQAIIEKSTHTGMRHKLQEWTYTNDRKYQVIRQSTSVQTASNTSDLPRLEQCFQSPVSFLPVPTTPQAVSTPLRGKSSTSTPANPFDLSFKKGKKFWVSTADKVYPQRLPLNQIIPIILKDEYVLVSGKNKPKSDGDWKDWKTIKGLYKAVLKAKKRKNGVPY